MGIVSNPGGAFALTRGRVLIAVSLMLTWWLAHLFPHYQPMIRQELNSRISEARKQIPSIKVDWHPSDDPRAKYNASKLALIIEPRPIPHLVPQLLHMTSVVPPDWRFLFIGTEKSVISVGRSYAIKHHQVIGKLDLMVLPEPWEINDKEHIYRLLTDMRFYDEFLPGVEWILNFESDSILCSNSGSSLNDWLEWSWAGAPRHENDRFAGNGGLSLRRVSVIRRVLQFQERYNNTEAEDEWFGKRLWILPGAKVAAGLDGALTVEDVYMERPMGYHIRDGGNGISDNVWKDPEQRKKIFEYCPELSLVMDMKLERERCPGDDKQGTIGPTAEQLAVIKAAEEKQKQEEEARRKALEEEEAKKKEVAEMEEKKKKIEEEERVKQLKEWLAAHQGQDNSSSSSTGPQPAENSTQDGGDEAGGEGEDGAEDEASPEESSTSTPPAEAEPTEEDGDEESVIADRSSGTEP